MNAHYQYDDSKPLENGCKLFVVNVISQYAHNFDFSVPLRHL
jgi:hypothetical protein